MSKPEIDVDKYRRRLLQGGLAGLGLAWLPWHASLADAVAATSAGLAADDDWNKLVGWLTGSDIDAAVLLRGRRALVAADPDFERDWRQLRQSMLAQRIQDADALATAALFQQETPRKTALAIISAFYLGHAGSNPEQALVSYEQALMYPPTLDVTVIPTYARGQYNDWVAAPQLHETEGRG
ncbi:sugar dehydrogenase complex small subunit [Frateuria aurantia]